MAMELQQLQFALSLQKLFTLLFQALPISIPHQHTLIIILSYYNIILDNFYSFLLHKIKLIQNIYFMCYQYKMYLVTGLCPK